MGDSQFEIQTFLIDPVELKRMTKMSIKDKRRINHFNSTYNDKVAFAYCLGDYKIRYMYLSSFIFIP